MKTVKEVSKITGISIRTLRYYDEIGLLKPTQISDAGYRLYDESALEKLQQILFFKEMEIPLVDIKTMMESPNYNRQKMLSVQKGILERKRNRLNGIIELIDDVMEGVNKMNFEAFNDEDVKKILDHSLDLQSEETKEALVNKFGSIEEYKRTVSENIKNEETSSELIKIYGSKDKAVEASLSATGNMDEFKILQDMTDYIYKQFAQAMKSSNAKLEMKCVEQLAENYKKMFHLDNARYLLLKTAEDYLAGSSLEEMTDQQYGKGITKYVGHAIQKYYGV